MTAGMATFPLPARRDIRSSCCLGAVISMMVALIN